jgi:iron(III) transport system ATP-binding protein
MTIAALELKDVTIRYGNVTAVDAASLKLKGGSLAALVGPSGCGKTSLLRAIAGFEFPCSGEIVLGGTKLVGRGTFVPPESRHIGMVFQEGALFPHLTVLENVAFGLARGDRQRADEVLRLVGLEALGHRRPHELSGGQQQRVALARALAPRPCLVLLDEPFGGLDAGLRVRLRGEVRDILHAAGTTAVLVTHDQEEALSMADQVSVMSRGRILQTGTPKEVYEEPLSVEVAALIGDAHLVRSRVTGGLVETPFGALQIEAADGECVVRIGSEDLDVQAGGEGVGATLLTSRYFGHDVIDEFTLDDGSHYRVRLTRGSGEPGARRTITLRSRRFRVFPDAGGAVTAYRLARETISVAAP